MNYGELIALLQRYLKRADLNDLIPDWIHFAGLRIDSDCKLAEQEFRSTTTPVRAFTELPDDFISMRNIQTDYRGALPLEYLDPESLDLRSRMVTTGPMVAYTIMDNQIQIIPTPSADNIAEIEIFYFARQPTFVNDADTSLVLTQFPNLFLYAAMIEAMPFMENQAGQATWATMYSDYRNLLNTSAEQARYSGSSIQMRPV